MTARLNDVSNKSFDYIVVGGGTAGLTVAGRLTADPSVSVLVVEAGVSNINEPDILRPASFGNHFSNKSYVWDHLTVRQTLLKDRQAYWPRGKGLGGSSAVNFLCWCKPSRRDVDDFERLGNPGWNWENFERHAKTIEGFVEPPKSFQERYKMNFSAWDIGKDGPLTVAYPATIGQGQMDVRETILNAGFPVAPLPQNGDPRGFQWMVQTLNPISHTRSYSTTAFYLPNKDRPNLTVLVSACAHRILSELSDDGQLVASQIEFEYEGQSYVANAIKEVILCAGCLKTPQLLELSGIGRRDVLEKINVPLKLELPGVGENVQEHLFVGVTYELKDDVDWHTIDIHRDPVLLAKHLEMHASGEGLFTTGISGFTFATLDMITSLNRAKQIYTSAVDHVASLEKNGAQPGRIEQDNILLARLEPGGAGRSPGCEIINFPGFIPGGGPNPPEPGKKYISILLALNHCFTRGTIHSATNDPAVDPDFDPRYFEANVDLEVLLEMVKLARRLSTTAPLSDMIVKELNPGPEVQTDDELREWIKTWFGTTFHTVGSCSMLPKEKDGVVDPNLKVYGTKNVRIADLSIVPLHFGAHSLSTAYVIGDRVATIIREKTGNT